MKIFISWSGPRSQAVAKILSDWIGTVIQATTPWISTEDIDRGAAWFSAIQEGLKDAKVGIICLTHENKDRPWILFESGALANGMEDGRVCTFLVDLESVDVKAPLSHFNATLPNKESTWKLVQTINRALSTGQVEDTRLRGSFEALWPRFKQEFDDAIATSDGPAVSAVRPDASELLAEILDVTRALSSRLAKLEQQLLPDGGNPYRTKGLVTGKGSVTLAELIGRQLFNVSKDGRIVAVGAESDVRKDDIESS